MESEDYLSLWEDDRIPCHICNRKFNPGSLEKHTNVCEKTLSKKRKPFDSTKQRIQGTELAEFLPVINTVTPQKPKIVKQTFLKSNNSNNSRWKENHMKLINIIEAAKETQTPVSASKSIKNNCEQCPYCDRSFGPKSFDRHIDWCKEQVYRVNQMSPAVQEAKGRLEARTKYRAPSIKSRRCVVRDKYCPKGRNKDDQYDAPQSKKTPAIKLNQITPKSEFKFSERSDIKPKLAETNFIRQNVLRCSYKKGPSNKPQTSKDQKKLTNDKEDDEDEMSATGIRIKPGQQNIRSRNNKTPSSTPVKSAKDVCDLYASAEQQMQKLFTTDQESGSNLNESNLNDILSRSYTISPENEKENESIGNNNGWMDNTEKHTFNRTDSNDSIQKFSRSPSSAFSKYIPENEIRIRTPTPVPTYSDDEYFSKDMNRYPLINLSNLSLCSTVSLDVPNDTRRNNYLDSRKTSAKKNLKMEHMLFGNNDEEGGGKISPQLSQTDLHEEFYKSVSEFKEMLEKTKEDRDFSSNTSSTSSPPIRSDLQNRTEADGNEISCGEENDHSASLNSKISIDSAYSSLNRKSPVLRSKINRSVSEMSDFRAISSTPSMDTQQQKLSKYCHECGAKYPLSVAKFCCECGIRRLVL